MSAFRAALVQMRSGVEPGANVETFRRLVTEAAHGGAEYVQTPEMTGMVERDREALMARLRTEDEDPLVAAAAELASSLGIYLHVGSTAIAVEGGKVANRAFLFGPDGAIQARYDKIHMFDVDLDGGESWRESRTYRPGRTAGLSEMEFSDGPVRIGLSVCYDLRFPHLYREQALAGAEVLTMPAAFTRQTGEAHWHVLLRARAIENGAYVLASAQGGRHEDGRETYGHSLAVDPWGRVIAEIADDEPGIAYATIDTEEVAAARAKIPNLGNARGFSVDGREIAVSGAVAEPS